ncbi:MAG: hypothetical protein RL188_706 [Bacteroidota bacterium]|jgi:uncharacterized NAD-dependent epimerase/dehydratase family protein
MKNAIVLTNGLLHHSDAKTAHGLIRGTERFDIVGVVDCAETAGQDAGVILDGKNRGIPVFATMVSAMQQLKEVDFLIIGVATVGGILPSNMLSLVYEAVQKGISVVNGLHEYLNDKADLVAIAQSTGAQLIDIRKPKSRADLHFWSGAIYEVTAPIVAVIGMDCAMGKRTTARMLKQACIAEGQKAEMIYTGQTGWLQGGQYGFIFDSTLNDFVSGELEHAVVSCWKETKPDILFLEGQSSLRNPSGPCGLELLISGNAKHVVLIFAPKRKYFDNEAHWGEIPSVASEIELIEKLGSKVIAVAVNTENCTTEEAYAYQKEFTASLGLPVLLPIQEGVAPVLPMLKALMKS